MTKNTPQEGFDKKIKTNTEKTERCLKDDL